MSHEMHANDHLELIAECLHGRWVDVPGLDGFVYIPSGAALRIVPDGSGGSSFWVAGLALEMSSTLSPGDLQGLLVP